MGTNAFSNASFSFFAHPDFFPALRTTVNLPGIFFYEGFPTGFTLRKIGYVYFSWFVFRPVWVNIIRCNNTAWSFLGYSPTGSRQNSDSIPSIMGCTSYKVRIPPPLPYPCCQNKPYFFQPAVMNMLAYGTSSCSCFQYSCPKFV